jgi:hypothetical protein
MDSADFLKISIIFALGMIVAGGGIFFIFHLLSSNDNNSCSYLITETNKYADIVNTDISNSNNINEQFAIKSISVEDEINIFNKYVKQYNYSLTHIEMYYNFLNSNEYNLNTCNMDKMGKEKWIRDGIVTQQNNINNMKTEITTEISQVTQQDYQNQLNNQYYDILKTIADILI